MRLDLEACVASGGPLPQQTRPQMLVQKGFEWAPRTTGLRPELGCHVLVQCQCSAHILMLNTQHLDVNAGTWHSAPSIALNREAVTHADREPGALPGRHLPRGIRAVRPCGATRLESADTAKHRAVGAAEDDVDSVPHTDRMYSRARANEENVIATREPAAQQPAYTLEPVLAREHSRIEWTTVAKERHELHGGSVAMRRARGPP